VFDQFYNWKLEDKLFGSGRYYHDLIRGWELFDPFEFNLGLDEKIDCEGPIGPSNQVGRIKHEMAINNPRRWKELDIFTESVVFLENIINRLFLYCNFYLVTSVIRLI
jgi:hypothetical protein